MPIYEYQAEYCLKSLFCPKRFAFWQNMQDAPVTACRECGAPLEKTLSVFSAGADVMAQSRASSDPPPDSTAPPPTLKTFTVAGWAYRAVAMIAVRMARPDLVSNP
ncbi:MAG: hypothetical protein F4090_04485 [Nitrospira sp. SB0672_bin_25]|nr:hypothetical protein [Nitrospira sp. SB0672_bin_25]